MCKVCPDSIWTMQIKTRTKRFLRHVKSCIPFQVLLYSHRPNRNILYYAIYNRVELNIIVSIYYLAATIIANAEHILFYERRLLTSLLVFQLS